MNKRRFQTAMIFLFVSFIILFAGCAVNNGPQVDPGKDAFDLLWEEAPEGTQAILINFPSEQQEADFPANEKLILDETNERFLLIPAEGTDKITVWSIEYVDDELKRTGEVYVNRSISDNFVLDMTVMRPEGGPYYELTIEGTEGVADYYISYNGKDGNPNIEYISAD